MSAFLCVAKKTLYGNEIVVHAAAARERNGF
jgi:hypothetical protein